MRTRLVLAGARVVCYQLVHVDVRAVEVHPAHPVLDVRLPPDFGGEV